jgi:hypothetical protein
MSKIQQNKQYMRLLLVKPNFITAYKLTITFKITSENFEITMKTYKLRSEVTQNFQMNAFYEWKKGKTHYDWKFNNFDNDCKKVLFTNKQKSAFYKHLNLQMIQLTTQFCVL